MENKLTNIINKKKPEGCYIDLRDIRKEAALINDGRTQEEILKQLIDAAFKKQKGSQ